MPTFKMTLSYDGTAFHGWQVQPGRRTVQEVLETALASILGTPVACIASGRTDAGVHARGQVVSFRSDTALPPATVRKATNARMPFDVAVVSCEVAADDFHANRDAVRKTYRYVILDGVRDPFTHLYALRSLHRLDADAMARAATQLLGTHDFHSFETNWPNRATSVRTVTAVSVTREGDNIQIDIEADGFLYNMVRTIVGTLMNVGRGYWEPDCVAKIIAAEDRKVAGPTAGAEGLYLMRVTYE